MKPFNYFLLFFALIFISISCTKETTAKNINLSQNNSTNGNWRVIKVSKDEANLLYSLRINSAGKKEVVKLKN